MDNFTCKICNLPFFSKFSLERHEQKKIKCNIKTEFKCDKCNKYFKQKKTLVNHTENNLCKIVLSIPNLNNESKNEEALLGIINSKITIESKIKLIKVINNTLIDENILEIINNDIPMKTKIILLNTRASLDAKTINNNTTNNTINYNFNNFDQENLEYLNEKYFKKLITTNAYGESIFLKLSNEIYLNEKHPENQTIKIDNLNNKFCKIKENNKWITTCKDTALKKIFDKVSSIVESCLHDNKDSIPEQKINIINGYIEKDFKDELVVEAVKKLAFNIYNFYNSII